jgi:predicted esterase
MNGVDYAGVPGLQQAVQLELNIGDSCPKVLVAVTGRLARRYKGNDNQGKDTDPKHSVNALHDLLEEVSLVKVRKNIYTLVRAFGIYTWGKSLLNGPYKNVMMNYWTLFLVFSGLVLPVQGQRQGNTKNMAAVRGYQNWCIGSYRCGLFVPPDYDPGRSYPLVLYLHGYTDTVTHDMVWYHEPILSKDPCIVLTPRCPKDEAEGWGTSFDTKTSPMMNRTYKMLDMVEKAFNLDPNRYYIYGTSMGGFGVYGVIRNNPDRFAAGCVLCGNGNIEMASMLTRIPLWIFHGSDDSVVSVLPTRELCHAVVNSGGRQIRYTEYAGAGHNMWDYIRNETTLYSWLLAQRRGSVHGKPFPVKEFKGTLHEKKVSLQWEVPVQATPPSDDDIWYCRIYRNGRLLKEVYRDRDNFTDSRVLLDHTYTYQISAVNYYFQESELSAPVSFSLTQ